MSRRSTPKHLLPLAPGGSTLLRATVERLAGVTDSVSIVTAADQAELCATAVAGLAATIIAEPEPRGTGPALALATRLIAEKDPGAVIASVHADHYVGDDAAYRDAVVAAAGWAEVTGGFATVGIHPSYPATGFGYVALGPSQEPADWAPPGQTIPASQAERSRICRAFRAAGFVEKPPFETAQRFLAEGTHLWNTGLFAWTAKAFEGDLHSLAPATADAIAEVVRLRNEGDDTGAGSAYRSIEKVAVEPLLFERTALLTVVQSSFPWSDVGSWKDLRDVRVESGQGDTDGNVVSGDAVFVDSRNNMVEARGGRLVALAGISDVVVVDTDDALLVVARDRAQLVKEIGEHLTAERPALT
jgi:mannose-1-phosphate guanylyltransferase